jgi:gliding motility-associated-like protein
MPDTVIALGQSIVLEASVTGPVTSYQWSPSAYLNNPDIDEPIATPQSVTTYQVLVTTSENCTASGKVTIGVYKTLTMPSSFTPNGDGINDIFRIPPSISVNISGFSVYDRWGRQVFFTKDPSVGWDGNTAGQVSPVGGYVWMIQYQDAITGKTVLAKGTVMLIR